MVCISEIPAISQAFWSSGTDSKSCCELVVAEVIRVKMSCRSAGVRMLFKNGDLRVDVTVDKRDLRG